DQRRPGVEVVVGRLVRHRQAPALVEAVGKAYQLLTLGPSGAVGGTVGGARRGGGVRFLRLGRSPFRGGRASCRGRVRSTRGNGWGTARSRPAGCRTRRRP